MNASEMARVYGYIRASTDRQIASPETQRQIIEEYAKRLGRTVDRFFIDPAVSGKKSLFDREAGKELPLILKRATRSSWPGSIGSVAPSSASLESSSSGSRRRSRCTCATCQVVSLIPTTRCPRC